MSDLPHNHSKYKPALQFLPHTPKSKSYALNTNQSIPYRVIPTWPDKHWRHNKAFNYINWYLLLAYTVTSKALGSKWNAVFKKRFWYVAHLVTWNKLQFRVRYTKAYFRLTLVQMNSYHSAILKYNFNTIW